MRTALLVLLLLVTSVGRACMNDRDTLGFELKNHPDVQTALSGRFDRFPPLYYQLRIDRLSHETTLKPDEYDDLAVAYARIGKNTEGLQVLARKKQLHGLTDNDQYRYYANKGTLEAHLWVQRGSKATDGALLESAIQDIRAAIRKNRKAHFGREGAQLAVLQWLQSLSQTKTPKTLSDFVSSRFTDGDPTVGLAGLIMLGGAWESPDVVIAIANLSQAMDPQRDQDLHAIKVIAVARYRELDKLGKKSFAPTLAKDELSVALETTRNELIAGRPEAEFITLRKEADEWHEKKTNYMLALLKQGRHPDTDPHFWDEWKEPAPPALKVAHEHLDHYIMRTQVYPLLRGVLVAVVVIVVLVVALVVRRRRRAL